MLYDCRKAHPVTPCNTTGGGANETEILSGGKHEYQPALRARVTMRRNVEVLLVDDDPAVRAIFARILRQADIGVLPVASGDAALELLHAGRSFDVIVSDLIMPGLSGTALLRRFRQLERRASIIIVTGDASALRSVELAGFRCLQKPIDNDELVAAVMTAASRAEG